MLEGSGLRGDDRLCIMINSLPKSGTHLLTRCLTLFPMLNDSKVRIHRSKSFSIANINAKEHNSLPVGIDDPRLLRTRIFEKQVRKIKPNSFFACHLPFSYQALEIVGKHGVKCVLTMRDPRDVVVSHVYYIKGLKSHFLHDYYRRLGDEQACLSASIKGVRPQDNIGKGLLDIGRRISLILEWQNQYDCRLTRFEALIGSRGGGNDLQQEEEVKGLAKYFGVEVTEREIKRICANMFGIGATFRKGRIGTWSEYFTHYHKDLFKEIAGEDLIKLGYEGDYDW